MISNKPIKKTVDVQAQMNDIFKKAMLRMVWKRVFSNLFFRLYL